MNSSLLVMVILVVQFSNKRLCVKKIFLFSLLMTVIFAENIFKSIEPSVPFTTNGAANVLENNKTHLVQTESVAKMRGSTSIVIDWKQLFFGSPIIYIALFFLSFITVGVGMYSIVRLQMSRMSPYAVVVEIRKQLMEGQYDEALNTCNQSPSIVCKIVGSAIAARSFGPAIMLTLMTQEGKMASNRLYSKITLLNDIAIIAPMIGLLGTVMGMFYAFYDLNRSTATLTAFFDGFGIAVGTTVAGLVVAIVALSFHTIAKQRLARRLVVVENEASDLAKLIIQDVV
jgi:biopolymer transport protein ExbB